MRIPVPFGGVFVLMALIAGVVVGFAMLSSAYRSSPRNPARARAGAAVLGGTAAFILLSFGAGQLFGIQEWNPYPVSDAALIGTWRDGDDRLDLRADGTYTLAASTRPIYGVSSAAGRWSRFDWNLRLDDAVGRHAAGLRVVVARGEYRLMPAPGDPDSWNGRLAYRRTPPATAP
jgi:hypothetical protein